MRASGTMVDAGAADSAVDRALDTADLGAVDSVDAGAEDVGADSTTATCPKVDVNSLLAEMADLRALSRRSSVKYRTYESSSYDRLSVTPMASSATPDGWFANTDWGNYLRIEQTPRGAEHVLMEADGPGAIVRIWTANGDEGTIRIYLDDMTTPAITSDFITLLSGTVAPFRSPFAIVNSRGRNLDFPLPYKRRAKVTLTGSARVNANAYFYQVFHRTYASCADVTTYRKEDVSAAVLDNVQSAFGVPPAFTELPATEAHLDSQNPSLEIPAAPGGTEIVQLAIRSDDLSRETLRRTSLSIAFDGKRTVYAPLGDFFGAGPGLIAHKTLPFEVLPDGIMISRFVMPFAEKATITLGLTGANTAVVRVKHRPAAFDQSTYYFHANWTARSNVAARPFRDLSIANIEGEGTYVGTMLSHDDLSPEWWGEGDERIWVDDDKFPSWFGTGTEDYFGYAYSTRDEFDHPYRLLKVTGSARGQLTNARFHVMDAIRFERAFRFDMEEWHWDPNASVFFDTVAYFYAAAGAMDKFPPAASGDFRIPR